MRRGLTLVELVLTISLVGILGIPTGLVISQYLRIGLASEDQNLAIHLARAEMERLDSLNDFFASPDLDLGATTIPNYQGSRYTLTRVVSCDAGDCIDSGINVQGIMRIEITVTRSDSTEPLARLISYRTKHVQFGYSF